MKRRHSGYCRTARFAKTFVGSGGAPSAWLLAIGDESGKALNQSELVLFDGLRKHGWIDGRNLIIEYRFSHPRIDCQLLSPT